MPRYDIQWLLKKVRKKTQCRKSPLQIQIYCRLISNPTQGKGLLENKHNGQLLQILRTRWLLPLTLGDMLDKIQ